MGQSALDSLIQYSSQLTVFPVFHHRIMFAQLLSRILKSGRYRPDVIALELPPSVSKAVLEGVRLKGSGPLWVGKRVEESLQTLPLSSLTGYRHTRAVIDATSELVMQTRRAAIDNDLIAGGISAESHRRYDAGHEPFVVIFDGSLSPTRHYTTVVLPERVYYASEAFGQRPVRHVEGIRRAGLAGRAWFTPPFFSQSPWGRSTWIADGHQSRAPRIADSKEKPELSGWRDHLLSRALGHCHRYVLYLAPETCPPSDDMLRKADANGQQIVHVRHDAVDRSLLSQIETDDHEWTPNRPHGVSDVCMESFSLHSGDAFLAAIRYAVENDTNLAWIDRELLDPAELEAADGRWLQSWRTRDLRFIEDSFLMEEGIERFFTRVRQDAELTRVEPVDSAREEHMAAHLKRLVAAGKQVLFVCGAAHWGRIRGHLMDSAFDMIPNEVLGNPASLLCSGQYSLMAGGDEIPSFLVEYEKLRLTKREHEYSPLRTWQDLEKKILQKLLNLRSVSPAEITRFRTYLARLARRTGVVVPRTYHLIEGARSFFGRAGQRTVLTECMRFFACPEGIPKPSGGHIDASGAIATINGDAIAIRSRWGGADYLFDRATRELESRIKSGRDKGRVGEKYATDFWEQHIEQMMIEARSFASPKMPTFESAPITNALLGRVDVRATIRARSRGDNRIYQRIECEEANTSLNSFEGFDPIIWLFESNVTQNLESMFIRGGDQDQVIGIGATPRHDLGGNRYRCEFQLLASWVPNFADASSALRDRVQRWLAQGHEKFVPTREAFDDAVERNSPDPVAAVLSLAADYSREYVIVVSPNRPDDSVFETFRAQRKKLFHINLDRFDPDDLEMMRTPEFG